jgi:hypothetical protein
MDDANAGRGRTRTAEMCRGLVVPVLVQHCMYVCHLIIIVWNHLFTSTRYGEQVLYSIDCGTVRSYWWVDDVYCD